MKLFKNKKACPDTGKFKLLVIDDNADQLHEVFGISEQRSDELLDICIHAYHKNRQLHECLVEIVDHCKHTNEVVFATMIMTRVIDKYNSKHALSGFLKNMFGNG